MYKYVIKLLSIRFHFRQYENTQKTCMAIKTGWQRCQTERTSKKILSMTCRTNMMSVPTTTCNKTADLQHLYKATVIHKVHNANCEPKLFCEQVPSGVRTAAISPTFGFHDKIVSS
jgi:hypothetical protein